jgi:DNA replication protein DnaC
MIEISSEQIPVFERRGIPLRTVLALQRFRETDATRKAMESPESLVVLAGHAGVGKSVAAAAWLFELAKGKAECMRWIQSGDLARGYAYDQEAFDGIANSWGLVVDDFGVEYLDEKGRFLTTLEEVLSRRFALMRRTLLTTNITDPAMFASRYGERITSRIHESGAFVVCGGPDLRRQPRNDSPAQRA